MPIPETDRRLGFSSAEAGSREQIMIPEGNVAYVMGEYKERSDEGNPVFAVNIGRVLRYGSREEFDIAKSNNKVDIYSETKEGKNVGLVGIDRLRRKLILVEPLGGGSGEGKVRLELHDISKYRQGMDPREREYEVDEEFFTGEGFDLDGENKDNYGATLGPGISQLLYEFQEGKGRFGASKRDESK